MTAINDLPLWAQILLNEKVPSSCDRRNSGCASAISKEVAEIMAECDNVFASLQQTVGRFNLRTRWVAGISGSCSEV